MKRATGLSGWVYSKRDGLSFFYILAKPQKYHLIESLTKHTKYLLKVFSTKTPSPFGTG